MTTYLKSFLHKETLGQIIKVGLTGGINTILFYVCLNILLLWFDASSFWAVTIAFAIGTVSSYFINRRWSFGIADGSMGSMRETLVFVGINLAAWAVTTVIVQCAERVWGPLSALEINIATLVATGLILLPKFAAYRDVVFKRSLESSSLS